MPQQDTKIKLEGLNNISAISPYIPGKPISELARELNLDPEKIVKLASNENPWGMSPKAKQAIYGQLNYIERYPDQFDLIDYLAKYHQVDKAQIALGNGSNDVLDLAARIFLNQTNKAVYSQYAFAVYAIATQSAGAEAIVTPADNNLGHDLNQIIKAANDPLVKLIWLANPNNPTGTFIPSEQLSDFLAQIPENVAIVLDEAYNEYLNKDDRYDSISWIEKFPNLIITRTFSKIYGLAGLRIGYAVASKYVTGLINRVRQPFNVNNLALAAALTAHQDHEFIEFSYNSNLNERKKLINELSLLGAKCLPAHGNFICFKITDTLSVNNKLLEKGVIVRPLAGYGMPEYLRVTVGTADENQIFISAMKQIINNEK